MRLPPVEQHGRGLFTGGQVGPPAVVAELVLEVGDGFPDGLTVNAEGFVWVQLYNGGAVRRYAPDGVLDPTIQLPVARVTAPARPAGRTSATSP